MTAALALLAASLLAVWSLVAATGDLRHGALPGALGLVGVASGLYLAALLVVMRGADRPARGALALVVLAAIALRLVLLPVEPSLSTDAWRYLWEGRVTLAGFDPYALAPASPALAALRDAAWAKVNHPEVPAVYGPVLEVLFAALAALPGGLTPFKLTFVAADLGVGLLLARALARRGRSPVLAVAWLWHPLPLLEVAGQAHLEPVPLFLLLLALDLEARGRGRAAALALGASIAAKLLPVLAAPALLARARDRRDGLARLTGLVLPGLLCALPFWRGLLAPVGDTGLGAFAATWRFNDGGFLALDAALRALGLSQAFCRGALPWVVDVPRGFDPAQHATWLLLLPKLVVGALVLVLVARVARRARGAPDLTGAAFAAAGVFLLLSPVVHPWYALWILPLLPLRRRGAGPWLLLTLALPLAYVALVRYDGSAASWVEEPWARACVYVPAAVWAAAARAPCRLCSCTTPSITGSP